MNDIYKVKSIYFKQPAAINLDCYRLFMKIYHNIEL